MGNIATNGVSGMVINPLLISMYLVDGLGIVYQRSICSHSFGSAHAIGGDIQSAPTILASVANLDIAISFSLS